MTLARTAYESDTWSRGYTYADSDDPSRGIREGDIVARVPATPATTVVAYAHGEVIASGSHLSAVRALQRVRNYDATCTTDDVPIVELETHWLPWAPILGGQPVEDARYAWREHLLPYSVVDTMLDAAYHARFELREFIAECAYRLKVSPADPQSLEDAVIAL